MRVLPVLVVCICFPSASAWRTTKLAPTPIAELNDQTRVLGRDANSTVQDQPVFTTEGVSPNDAPLWHSVQSFLNVTQWSSVLAPVWAWNPLGSPASPSEIANSPYLGHADSMASGMSGHPVSPMVTQANSKLRTPNATQRMTLSRLSKLASAARVLRMPTDPMNVLMSLGGGTGASIGGNGTSMVDRDLLRRMHYQDKAVMLLVMAVYFVALWFSATLTFRASSNHSPVTYYADPRFHDMVMEGNDLDNYLSAFDQPPKNIALQVTGYEAVPEDFQGSFRWRGENYQIAFTFSLDISTWVQRATHTVLAGPQQQVRSLQDGMLPEHRSMVYNFLTNDSNDLSYIELNKEVEWPGWEELATNIKHQIRQRGFNGLLAVNRIEKDEVNIYKNKTWANFMHARATRVLCALSIVGWVFYVPYMWLRCKKVTVQSFYRVEVNMSDYWQLISDKLTADGFRDGAQETVPRNSAARPHVHN